MARQSQTVAIEHLKDLTPDPKNARHHTARNIGMIADGLQEIERLSDISGMPQQMARRLDEKSDENKTETGFNKGWKPDV